MGQKKILSQRDSFWNKVYDIAKTDKDIVIVSADMGAPSLDKFRADLPEQFVNTGIAEQNAAVVAAGLAMSGKKVFLYAIAPFITLRCLEQIRVENAMMKIPVTIVGVGAGFSYDDSGPTHHLIEDLTIMRSMPHIEINSVSDGLMAEKIAELSCDKKITNYVRLERAQLPDIYQEGQEFNDGMTALRKGKDGSILTTGCMVHSALDVVDQLAKTGRDVGVIDIYTIPINVPQLQSVIKDIPFVFTLEEHFLAGGLGSAILEVFNDNGIKIPVKRLGLEMSDGYCYKYGGRPEIHAYYGIDKPSLIKKIEAAF